MHRQITGTFSIHSVRYSVRGGGSTKKGVQRESNDEDSAKTPLPDWAWPSRMGNGIVLVEVEIILVCFSTNATVDWFYRRWPVDKVPVRLVYSCYVELSV